MKNKPYRLVLYIFVRMVGFLLYPLPLKIGIRIGSVFGRLAFFILPKEREKTLTHLKIALGREKSEREIKKIAINLFSNLGKNAIEWLNFPKINKDWFERYVEPEGLVHIREAHKRGKGVIILASHFGNWELMAAYLAHIGCRGAMIVRRIYIEQFNQLIVNMRKNKGHDVIYRDESPKKVLRVLKNNSYLGILADQDIDSVEGVFVDFFGKPAYTPVAPVKLAIKTGAALIPAFLIREDGKFRFMVEKEVSLDISGDRERDLLINTIKWTKVIERYIRKYPDQWVWMHRRWKTRPKEEAKPVTADQMQSIDRIAQERHNIPSFTLMENAGKAAASLAMDILSAKDTMGRKKRILVFCGKGNNGGDGLVISHKLIENGLDVITYLLCSETELKNDPAINFTLLKKLNADIIILKKRDDLSFIRGLSDCDLIIDAIFGTGFKGRPKGLINNLINLINRSGAKVLSIDVPSGLDATTGRCEGTCIKATETITFGLPKTGFYRSSGPRFTGRITIKNIGFPDSLLNK